MVLPSALILPMEPPQGEPQEACNLTGSDLQREVLDWQYTKPDKSGVNGMVGEGMGAANRAGYRRPNMSVVGNTAVEHKKVIPEPKPDATRRSQKGDSYLDEQNNVIPYLPCCHVLAIGIGRWPTLHSLASNKGYFDHNI
jgi:hypothetical protein